MKKYTWSELISVIREHNKEHNITTQYGDNNPLHCVAVISQDSFKDEYSLEARSYRFRSDNKFFISNMGGNSIFSETLDRSDRCRLDWYIYGKDAWKIEYCYVEKMEGE